MYVPVRSLVSYELIVVAFNLAENKVHVLGPVKWELERDGSFVGWGTYGQGTELILIKHDWFPRVNQSVKHNRFDFKNSLVLEVCPVSRQTVVSHIAIRREGGRRAYVRIGWGVVVILLRFLVMSIVSITYNIIICFLEQAEIEMLVAQSTRRNFNLPQSHRRIFIRHARRLVIFVLDKGRIVIGWIW